ncbi:MAG TPA: glycosyltransferase family 4 protein [Baekduia sp.]|uniref:glycosyltransferase family 4 protein n=1 Tax=Baekduia sp. TaxID=2600305 RepID=UPI002D79B78A|nr:glycosyltransferase family 4 protein [Baekduia sp.]HET6509524.1 glycosyltransferase family 4 protein [Baekduia sp.]
MGLGIKTKIKRKLAGPFVNDEYVEIQELTALRAAPKGALLPAPAVGAKLSLAFVVPFFVRGSGGHTTIANLVRALERRGHTCSIWIDDPGRRLKQGPARAADDFRDWFGPFAAGVTYGFEGFAGADVVLATGWQTLTRALTLPAAGRAYLVQDHEPEFFGTSVQRAYAEDSYRHDVYAITAGRWLADTMGELYGLPATSFDLGIDGERYQPDPSIARRTDVVVAYARSSTPRRGVPVALAALGELHRRRPRTEAWLFGHGGPPGVDFPYRNLGVVPEAQLPAYYAEATVGLVLSMTNYSLVAQEMLSCGLPCVELDAPSVVKAFGRDGPVDFAPLDPIAIADVLERLLTDADLRAARARGGAALRGQRTWDHAAEQVEQGLVAAIAHTQRGGG